MALFASNAEIVVVTSDRHPNDKTGLFNARGFVDDDGMEYQPSKAQAWLWECWLDFWKTIKDLKKNHKVRKVTWYDLGDGADANTHSNHVLVVINKADLIQLAVETMEPGIEVADEVGMLRGTFAHTGQQGELEELVGRQIGAIRGEDGRRSHYRLKPKHAGVGFDFAHKPRSNSMRPWTRGGAASRVAAMLLFEYASEGIIKPDWPRYAVRGHVHHVEDSGWTHPIRVLFCMPLKLHGSYEESMQFEPGPVGGYVFICKDGLCQAGYIKYTPEGKQTWFG